MDNTLHTHTKRIDCPGAHPDISLQATQRQRPLSLSVTQTTSNAPSFTEYGKSEHDDSVAAVAPRVGGMLPCSVECGWYRGQRQSCPLINGQRRCGGVVVLVVLVVGQTKR